MAKRLARSRPFTRTSKSRGTRTNHMTTNPWKLFFNSFPCQICPNSAGQFAKDCRSQRQNFPVPRRHIY